MIEDKITQCEPDIAKLQENLAQLRKEKTENEKPILAAVTDGRGWGRRICVKNTKKLRDFMNRSWMDGKYIFINPGGYPTHSSSLGHVDIEEEWR